MRKWIETTGRSEEDAIAAALFQLGLDRDDVSVEVIERAKSGFLGFGGNPAKVRVSYEVPGEDEEPSSPAPEKETKPISQEEQPQLTQVQETPVQEAEAAPEIPAPAEAETTAPEAAPVETEEVEVEVEQVEVELPEDEDDKKEGV